jgi:N-terminal acetyltransferase B complex catalytic subunit
MVCCHRVSNSLAINMYNKFGYTVFRRVIGYYSGDDEDAFGASKTSNWKY